MLSHPLSHRRRVPTILRKGLELLPMIMIPIGGMAAQKIRIRIKIKSRREG
jgi:phosphatidylserine decarboxylase